MPSYLIETDILLDFLLGSDSDTVLAALSTGSCYTTMYNALELFRYAKSDIERNAVKDLLSAVRVLGFHFRYSDEFSMIASRIELDKKTTLTDREILIIGMAEVSKLTIITRTNFDRFHKLIAGVIRSIEPVPA